MKIAAKPSAEVLIPRQHRAAERDAARTRREAALPKPGELIYSDDGEEVQCHVCGRWYKNLGAHSAWKHTMTADEYREEYGLARSMSLDPPVLAEKKRQAALARDQASVLAQHRVPYGDARNVPRGHKRRLSSNLKQKDMLARKTVEQRRQMMAAAVAAQTRRWTREELDYLLQEPDDDRVALRLNRTHRAIEQKRRQLRQQR